MNDTKNLIEAELRKRKIRYTVEDELFELFIGSFNTRIQVDSDDTLQIWICDDDESTADNIFEDTIECDNGVFIHSEIAYMLDELIVSHKDITMNVNKIENLLKDVTKLRSSCNISESFVMKIWDGIQED